MRLAFDPGRQNGMKWNRRSGVRVDGCRGSGRGYKEVTITREDETRNAGGRWQVAGDKRQAIG